LNTIATRQKTFATIALPSNDTIRKALDPSPHEAQEQSILILRTLSNIFTSFPDTKIVLLWLPRKTPFVGFKRAKQLALEAIRSADITEITEPHTISNQKDSAKKAAIKEWADKWHQSPLTSKAYQTALTTPPDGKPHITFHVTKDQDKREGTQAKFSRLTHSTLYRFITGHAFTGEYTQRFFSKHTPEQIACQCGERLQSVDHVLFQCPLFTDVRRKHLSSNSRLRSFPQLLKNPKRIQSLLRFLEETRACNKPQAEWEPG
jgi:hypothetical protein